MPRFQHVQLDKDNSVWRFYHKFGDQEDYAYRPCFAIMTACHQAGLFRIIHESLNLYCGLRGLATADAVLVTYRRYIDWENDLMPDLKRINISGTRQDEPLPHVLFLQYVTPPFVYKHRRLIFYKSIQYHTAVVQHLTPIVQCGYFSGSNLNELRKIIIYHAQSGIEILERSRRLYSTRFCMPLMTFCIVHLSDALIRFSPNDPPAVDVVNFCLSMLQQARTGFPLCGPLQELFRQTAMECNVPLPENIDQMIGLQGHYGMDDFLDACTRLDYKQPVDQSVRHVDSSIGDEWPAAWEKIVNSPERPVSPESTRRTSTSERFLPIDSLLNS